MLDEKYASCKAYDAVVFANGISEIFLESVLNSVLSKAADCEGFDSEKEDVAADGSCGDELSGEVLLYFCARSEADLNALSEYEAVGYGRIPVVRLGGEEIRRDVIDYYAGLALQTGVLFCTEYEACDEFVNEEELGWEMAGVCATWGAEKDNV